MCQAVRGVTALYEAGAAAWVEAWTGVVAWLGAMVVVAAVVMAVAWLGAVAVVIAAVVAALMAGATAWAVTGLATETVTVSGTVVLILTIAGTETGTGAVVGTGAWAGAWAVLAGLGLGAWYRAKEKTDLIRFLSVLAFPWFCSLPIVIGFASFALYDWLSWGWRAIFLFWLITLGLCSFLWLWGQKRDYEARNPLKGLPLEQKMGISL